MWRFFEVVKGTTKEAYQIVVRQTTLFYLQLPTKTRKHHENNRTFGKSISYQPIAESMVR